MKLRAPSTSTAIASLALFVAMGGTSYAVAKLPKNSVRSQQVVDGSLAAKDLAPGVLQVVPGPRGPRGAPGSDGQVGPPGVSQGYVNRVGQVAPIPSGQGRTLINRLRIPAGSYAIDFSANAFTTGPGVFLDCGLEASDARVSATTARLGGDAGASVQQQIGMTDAMTFAGPVTLNVFCNQRGIDSGVNVVEARLRALRIGALELQ